MHTKFVILGIIGTLLVAAIYTSSTYFVFAEIVTSCVGTSKTTTNCSTYDTETDEGHNYKCTKNKDGKTWSCDEIKAVKGDSIPTKLKYALAVARADIQNATQVPKNLGGLEDNVIGEGPRLLDR